MGEDSKSPTASKGQWPTAANPVSETWRKKKSNQSVCQHVPQNGRQSTQRKKVVKSLLSKVAMIASAAQEQIQAAVAQAAAAVLVADVLTSGEPDSWYPSL